MTSPVSSCSSDYDAAEVFAASLIDQVNREDVRNMVYTQREMLSRFEKTNEMLINFNILSANRCAATSQEFKKHTQLLYEMKKDLDSVFKRIRVLKDRLGKSYPEAFKSCGSTIPVVEEEEDEEESVSSSKSSQSVTENQSRRESQETENQSATKQTSSVQQVETSTVQTEKSEHQSKHKQKSELKDGKKESSKDKKSTHET